MSRQIEHEQIIIIAGLIAILVVIAILFYTGQVIIGVENEIGWKQYCDSVMFGDSNKEGYVLEKVKHCNER